MYEFMHETETKCSDNRGVRIIEVRIIEVALYICLMISSREMICFVFWIHVSIVM